MRLLLLILITACALIIAALISTTSLAFFCTANIDRKSEALTINKDPVQYNISGKQTGAGCDYTVGKWVKSEIKPLYSGDTCKQWLAGMWACRLMPARPNFDYENYRWQPEACDLPVFDSQEFLSRMRNKVLAFIGDSIGRQQHQSLMCMLTGGKDDVMIEDVSLLYGLKIPPGSLRPDGIAHRFLETNTTIIYYWSASLCDIQSLNKTDPNTYYAMHLDRPVMFLQRFIGMMDVVVLNTGHHWNKGKINANRWVMHVDGQLNTDARFRDIAGFARNFSLGKIIAWLDDQIIHNNTKAEVYMRSLSPRHFFEGEWDSGGRCDNNLVPVEEKNITGQVAVDPIAESAVWGRRVHLLNITYISQFRDEAHISKYRPNQSGQDCLHWCLPGVPDVWNELLYANLFFHGGQISCSTS